MYTLCQWTLQFAEIHTMPKIALVFEMCLSLMDPCCCDISVRCCHAHWLANCCWYAPIWCGCSVCWRYVSICWRMPRCIYSSGPCKSSDDIIWRTELSKYPRLPERKNNFCLWSFNQTTNVCPKHYSADESLPHTTMTLLQYNTAPTVDNPCVCQCRLIDYAGVSRYR